MNPTDIEPKMKPTQEETLLIYQQAEWECRNAATVLKRVSKQVLHTGNLQLWAILALQAGSLSAAADEVNWRMEKTL